jgi:hypothetical protein
VQAIPGVESASIAGDVPLEGTGGENLRTRATGDERLLVRFKRADPGLFPDDGSRDRQGTRLQQGPIDSGSAYVTLINEALARDLNARFGMTESVGQVVDLPAIGYGSATSRTADDDHRHRENERVQSDLRADVLGIAYVPIAQAPILWNKLSVRTRATAHRSFPRFVKRCAASIRGSRSPTCAPSTSCASSACRA